MRFVKEYADYVIAKTATCELMNSGIKAEIIKRVNDYMELYRLNFMTTDEIMRILSHSCMSDGEDMGQYMI